MPLQSVYRPIARRQSAIRPRRGTQKVVRSAFTMIEMMIMVVIIGILTAIVVPMFKGKSTEAGASTIMTQLHTLREVIDVQKLRTGHWPNPLDTARFVGGIPERPQNSSELDDIRYFDAGDTEHPDDKVLRVGGDGAFWHNVNTGAVRATVADQGTSDATIDSYNRVNPSSETDLGNYSGGVCGNGDGGGGGGS